MGRKVDFLSKYNKEQCCMITEFIDHAQQIIAQRGGLSNAGFFRPCHPCVISLNLKEKIDIKPLQDVLAFYWGNACAKAIPFLHIDNESFSHDEVLYGLLHRSCSEVLAKSRAFSNLLELYFVDIIECDAVEDDDTFEEHCCFIRNFSIENHTIHKILVLIHNHNQTAPETLLKPLNEFKSGNRSEIGYDTIFVMSDALKSGAYENDKIRRLTDFMSVLAFNTDDNVNFRNSLNGVVGFRESILTVSAQKLRKPNREIAMASLYGITSSLSGDAETQIVNRITEKQLKELFNDEKINTLKDVDTFFEEVKKSENFPKTDLFDNLPYSDPSLNTNHTFYADFFNLAVKVNFFGCVDNWIQKNKVKVRKTFLEKLFSIFSFSDLQDSENKNTINKFLEAYMDDSEIKAQNYESAVMFSKQYFLKSITKYWKKELAQIVPNLKKVQKALHEIGLELIDQLHYYVTDDSIIDFYSKKSKEFLESDGQKLRNNLIFCSGNDDNLKRTLLNQIQERSDVFFKNDDVSALNYNKELNTRMQNLTSATFDAVDFVANEIKFGNGTNVYFPPHGMANFTTLQEICVLPNDDTLANKLRTDLPSVSLKQISSGNECVRIAVLKVE